MNRTMCWLTVGAAMVIAACTTENEPTATRFRRTVRPLVTLDSEKATLGTAKQALKGWGLYPVGESGLPSTAVGDSLYTMGANYIRDQLDPSMYTSGTTYPVTINSATLTNWVNKWNDAKTRTGSTIKNYVLSIWSPPAAFKTNGSVDGYILGDNNPADSNHVGYLIRSDEGAFVAYITTVLDSLKSRSVGLPAALSVQNEPLNLVDYPGCLYTDTSGATTWGSVVKSLRGSLDYIGITAAKTILYGPETSNYAGVSPFFGGNGFPSLTPSNYLDSAVTNFAFHTYFEGVAAVIDSTTTGMTDASPQRDSWMTEYSQPAGSSKVDWLLNTFSDMGAALVIVPNNYWFWWDGWLSAPDTEQYGVLMTGTSTAPYPSKRYYALKKIWTYITPGNWKVAPMGSTTDSDLHIALGTQSGDDPQVDLWAFNSTDGTQIAVIISNHTTKEKILNIGGFPTTFTAQHSWMSDSTHDMWADTSTNVYEGYTTIHIEPRSLKFAVMNKDSL